MGEQGETDREGSRVEEASLLLQDGERSLEKVKFSSNIVKLVVRGCPWAKRLRGLLFP